MILSEAIREIEKNLPMSGIEVYRDTAVIQTRNDYAKVGYGVVSDSRPYIGSFDRVIEGYYVITLLFKEETDITYINTISENIVNTMIGFGIGDEFIVTNIEVESLVVDMFKRIIQPITIYFILQN